MHIGDWSSDVCSSDLHAAAAAGELLAGGSVDSVGIAVPGVVNRDGRMLHANDKYDWARDIDLRSWGARCFGAPVIVENAAPAALVGEVREGAEIGSASCRERLVQDVKTSGVDV